MRLVRRAWGFLLLGSIIAVAVLLAAALLHDPAAWSGAASAAVQRWHQSIEVALWSGVAAAGVALAAGVAWLRREVRSEKLRRRRERERRDLLRSMRQYYASSDESRLNN
jgi:hypothetical protein